MSDQNEVDLINQQISTLMAQKESILSARRHEVIKAVRKQIADYSLTARELGLSGQDRGQAAAKSAPKYANPANKAQTWPGGRGAKPRWVREHLANGGTLDDLLIK